MQKINFRAPEGVQAVEQRIAPVDVAVERAAEWFMNKKARAEEWYEGYSAFYSLVVGEKVTRKVVVRIHCILLCLFVLVIAAAENIMVALAAMAATAWLVYRLNADEQSNEQRNGKKGGRK